LVEAAVFVRLVPLSSSLNLGIVLFKDPGVEGLTFEAGLLV
jgi:hypothetical protein